MVWASDATGGERCDATGDCAMRLAVGLAVFIIMLCIALTMWYYEALR